jgi:hypothetical protein
MKLRIGVGRKRGAPLQIEATDFEGQARVTVLFQGDRVLSEECADPPCHALAMIPAFTSWGPQDHFGVVVENEGRTTEIEISGLQPGTGRLRVRPR